MNRSRGVIGEYLTLLWTRRVTDWKSLNEETAVPENRSRQLRRRGNKWKTGNVDDYDDAIRWRALSFWRIRRVIVDGKSGIRTDWKPNATNSAYTRRTTVGKRPRPPRILAGDRSPGSTKSFAVVVGSCGTNWRTASRYGCCRFGARAPLVFDTETPLGWISYIICNDKYCFCVVRTWLLLYSLLALLSSRTPERNTST